MQRSVLTLLDFSKIYDTVWQEKFLLCIIDTGIPMTLILYLRSFPTNSRACGQLHNVFSSSRCFNQGLPQGLVLVLLLFLFYFNDLAENFSNNTVIALFADNVSILTTVHKRKTTLLQPS